ncbi:ECF-type sigma factor [Saliniradius amylolyticus]|uniref:ECF-type sigma factor n=1 Tax=Saliniradius amylolyticus TaxID=2183582 RepID=UPI0013A5B228|nr:ECF-type sigma factor [Saliniradius amylolyticus]
MKLIKEWGNGCERSSNTLKTLLYYHLKQVCQAHLERSREEIDVTSILNHLPHTTSLLHQALIELVPPGMDIEEERQLNNYLSLFIRNLLKDEIRKLSAKKRTPKDIVNEQLCDLDAQERFMALDSAMVILESERPRAAEAFSLRYFLGYDVEEIARFIESSLATAYRELSIAQAFLRAKIEEI